MDSFDYKYLEHWIGSKYQIYVNVNCYYTKFNENFIFDQFLVQIVLTC